VARRSQINVISRLAGGQSPAFAAC